MSISIALVMAVASPFADLDAIDVQVAQFTGRGIGEEGGAMQPVDRRLKLRPCASPLALSWNAQRRETVVVRCHDAGGWRLYVPVKAEAAAAAALPAVNRGDAVTIAVTGEGFSVSQPGEAMEGGPVGSWIKVRVLNGSNRNASQAMSARIIRPGLVGVPLP